MGATEIGVQLMVACAPRCPVSSQCAPADEVGVVPAEDQSEFFLGADALAAQAVHSVFQGGLAARVLFQHLGRHRTQQGPDGRRLRPRGLKRVVASQDVGDEELRPAALGERGEQRLRLRLDGLQTVRVHVKLAGHSPHLVQQRGQAGRGKGDAEGGGSSRFDVVRLVKDDEIVVGQQLGVRLPAASDGEVAEEQGVVDQQQVGLLRAAPHSVVEASVEKAALLALAGVGIGPDVGPARIRKVQFGRRRPTRW